MPTVTTAAVRICGAEHGAYFPQDGEPIRCDLPAGHEDHHADHSHADRGETCLWEAADCNAVRFIFLDERIRCTRLAGHHGEHGEGARYGARR